jgi:hypothetical protein
MNYVLDTDILSLLARQDSPEAPRIRRRIAELPPEHSVVTTVINYEDHLATFETLLKVPLGVICSRPFLYQNLGPRRGGCTSLPARPWPKPTQPPEPSRPGGRMSPCGECSWSIGDARIGQMRRRSGGVSSRAFSIAGRL